jgi:hypothetical protein
MDAKLKVRFELLAALCGPLFVICYLVFWGLLGHNIPPPSPAYSAPELVAHYYGPFHNDILLGMVGCAVAGILYLPWSAQLSVMMNRADGDIRVLSYTQLLGGAITAWLLAECPAIWVLAAYTPTSQPDLVQFAHREAWFIYDLTYLITTVQMLACGAFAIFCRRSVAILPRWAGWLAIAGGLSFVPLCAIAYVTSGPLALNGGWNFYVVFGIWLLWFATYSVYMLKDVLSRLQVAVTDSGAPLTHSAVRG